MQGKPRERERENNYFRVPVIYTGKKSRLTIPTNGNLLKTTKKHPEGRSTTTLKRPTKRRFAANQSQVSPFSNDANQSSSQHFMQ